MVVAIAVVPIMPVAATALHLMLPRSYPPEPRFYLPFVLLALPFLALWRFLPSWRPVAFSAWGALALSASVMSWTVVADLRQGDPIPISGALVPAGSSSVGLVLERSPCVDRVAIRASVLPGRQFALEAVVDGIDWDRAESCNVGGIGFVEIELPSVPRRLVDVTRCDSSRLAACPEIPITPQDWPPDRVTAEATTLEVESSAAEHD